MAGTCESPRPSTQWLHTPWVLCRHHALFSGLPDRTGRSKLMSRSGRTWDNLCIHHSLLLRRFPQGTHPNTTPCRELWKYQHRQHSHPPWDHCTPDSFHGRGHTGVSQDRSVWDRDDGTCHYIGRIQACILCKFFHGCSPGTSLDSACRLLPWPRVFQGKFASTSHGLGRNLLHKRGSWWHFLHMFCKGSYSVRKYHLLHRSPLGSCGSTCHRGEPGRCPANSGTFGKGQLQSKRHSPRHSFHSGRS